MKYQMANRVALLLILASTAPLGFAQLVAGQSANSELDAKLGKRLHDYKLGTCSSVGALIRVSKDFQVPLGITSIETRPPVQVPFSWTGTTVQDVIKSIASAAGYRVSRANGVVHLSSAEMIPDSQNFLKLRIQTFQVRNTIPEVALFKLHDLLNPSPRGNKQVSIAGPGDSTVDLDFHNATAEDILDAIAVASPRKIWVVTFTDSTNLTAGGFRRVTSLWRDIPNSAPENQLGWDSLRWDNPAPPPVACDNAR